MAKYKNKKKTIPYKSSGVVKYGADKYAVLSVLLYPVFLTLINIKDWKNEFFLTYVLFVPFIIPTVYCFRFRLEYDLKTREIQYRNFFKFRTIYLKDIKKVYRKSDGKTTFLIIKTDRKKIRINMRSCNGSRELSFFLKRHVPKKFE